MLKIKKLLYIVLTVLFSLTATSELLAQQSDKTEWSQALYEKLEQSLYFGLSSDVDGVVESALFNMLNYKVVYPQFNSDNVLNKAKEIANRSESNRISERAELVIRFYENQEDFPEAEQLLAVIDHTNQDRIFEFLKNGDYANRYTSTQK